MILFSLLQQVNDMESYVFSLTEANNNPAQGPRWFRHFGFRQAYGVTDLSPAGLDRLAFDMSRNRNLLRLYWEHRAKGAEPRLQGGCNDDCLRGTVCSIVRNQHEDQRRCNQVLAVFGTVA